MTTTPTRSTTSAGAAVPALMQAVRLHEPGAPDALRLEEVPAPRPGPGEVLVAVETVGVNHADVLMARGGMPAWGTLPTVLGFESAGRVVEVGGDADAELLGRRVTVMGTGAYAEYVVAPAATVIPVPEQMDAVGAAAWASSGLTAYGMLRAAGLTGGETVLVHAAGSGVGTLAVQVARLLGAGRVLATASSTAKRELAGRLGADTVADSRGPWAQQLADDPGGRAVDVVLDLAGGTTAAQSLPLLTPATGRAVLGGTAGGAPELDPARLIPAATRLVGYSNPAWLAREGFAAEASRALLGWITGGELEVVVGAILPLAEARAAHEAIAARRTIGKTVLRTDPGATADVDGDEAGDAR